MTRQELLAHYQAQLCALAKELVDDQELEAAQQTLTAARQIDAVLDELSAGGVEDRAVRARIVEPWQLQHELGRLANDMKGSQVDMSSPYRDGPLRFETGAGDGQS